VGLCLLLAACSTYRLNHVHNAANQKLSEQSLEVFEAVASDRAGGFADQLHNVQAAANLDREVSRQRVVVREAQRLHAAAGLSWAGLNEELMADLGILDVWEAVPTGRPWDTYARLLRFHHAQGRTDLARECTVLLLFQSSLDRRSVLVEELDLTEEQQQILFDSLPGKLREIGMRLIKRRDAPGGPASSDDGTREAFTETLQGLDAEGVAAVVFPNSQLLANALAEVLEKWSGFLDPATASGRLVERILESRQGFGRMLDARIEERLTRVIAIAKVLEALAAGQTALVKNATAQVSQASAAVAKLGGAKKVEGEQTNNDLADLFRRFRAAVRDAAKASLARAKELNQATELQRTIIEAAERSRDPETIYALVPLVGSGLGDDDLAALDAFHAELAKRLAPLSTSATPATEGIERRARDTVDEARALMAISGGQVPAAPEKGSAVDELFDGLDKLAALVEAASRLGVDVPDELEDVLAAAKDLRKAAAALSALGETTKLADLPDNLNAVIDPLREALVKLGLEEQAAALGKPQSVLQAAAALRVVAKDARKAFEQFDLIAFVKKDGVLDRAVDALGRVHADLGLNVERLRSAVDKLQATVADLPVPLPETIAILKKAAKGDKITKDDVLDLIEKGLPKLLDNSPGMKDALEKALESRIKLKDGSETTVGDHLASILSDIKQGQLEAKRRIAEYLLDLHRVQLDLHGENARHYAALLSIGRSELKRWILLRDEGAEFAALLNPKSILFDDPTAWNNGVTGPKTHAEVEQSDQVLTTLRGLSATAHAWQTGDPRDDKGAKVGGEEMSHAELSNNRLRRAVGSVNQYLLLTSLNLRYAEENGVRLRTEVAEHDLQLDHVVSRATEAGIRYSLRELVAFHTSGITEDDLRAVIGFIHNGLLLALNFQV
jgi:hypothetical protein